ncbi:MAG: hypothetical protein HY908_33615 [Myxococcales bacterium]|nr:hypothetical protein [Myxococcales bacterium]
MITTYPDAIAWLRTAGFPAEERTWSLGHTIVVPADPSPPDRYGIVLYARVIYLVPTGVTWTVMEMPCAPDGTDGPVVCSLDAACHLAAQLLSHDTAPLP